MALSELSLVFLGLNRRTAKQYFQTLSSRLKEKGEAAGGIEELVLEDQDLHSLGVSIMNFDLEAQLRKEGVKLSDIYQAAAQPEAEIRNRLPISMPSCEVAIHS